MPGVYIDTVDGLKTVYKVVDDDKSALDFPETSGRGSRGSGQSRVYEREPYDPTNPPVDYNPFGKKKNRSIFYPRHDRPETSTRPRSSTTDAKSPPAPTPTPTPEEVSEEVYGKPVEEVDPFVFDDTFCVISRKFNKNFVYRFSSSRSLYIFSSLNPIRRLALRIITHELFDVFIILVILCNCIALAFDSNELRWEPIQNPKWFGPNGENEDHQPQEHNLPQWLEWTFLLIYTLEALLKIIAKGLILNKFSYFRSGWNIMDFLIVAFGYGTEIIILTMSEAERNELEFLDLFRTSRVLRAVKAVSILPGLRMMINALLHSMVQLIEVMALILFSLGILALLAMQVFAGKLRHVCVLANVTNLTTYTNQFGGHLSNLANPFLNFSMNESHWLTRTFPKNEFVICGNETGARHCPDNFTCTSVTGDYYPDEGWTSFDSIDHSLLSTWQLLTLDYWERIYDLIMSAIGPWSVPFFIIVVFGSFYLLNLMLAVVTRSYETEARSWNPTEVVVKPLSKSQKLALHRTDSTFSFDDPLSMRITVLTENKRRTPVEREILAHSLAHATAAKGGRASKTVSEFPDASEVETMRDLMLEVLKRRLAAARTPELFEEAERVKEEDKEVALVSELEEEEINEDEAPWDEYKEQKLQPLQRLPADLEVEGELWAAESGKPKKSKSKKRVEVDGVTKVGQKEETPKDDPLPPSPTESLILKAAVTGEDPQQVAEVRTITSSIQIALDETQAEEDEKITIRNFDIDAKMTYATKYEKLQVKFLKIAAHPAFDSIMMLCIVLNTILLASEHYGQPHWVDHLINYGGYFFTVMFTLECVVKILALGRDFFADNWNNFDLCIVITSWIDITIQIVIVYGGIVNTFRVVRLLRIFKLAHRWFTMKVLLNIIFASFGALGNLVLVLGIFIYIFAILGMQIVGQRYTPANFGHPYEERGNVADDFPRWNFMNFWYSFMMVFRVLCGEWVEPLWDCLHAHKENPHRDLREEQWKCFIIFMPVLIIGNFIILNLFLALLLNSFSTEELKAQGEKAKSGGRKDDNLKKIVGILLAKKAFRGFGGFAKKEDDVPGGDQTEGGEDADKLKQNKFSVKINEETDTRPTVLFKKATQKVIMHHRKSVAQKAIAKMEENEWKREAGIASDNDLQGVAVAGKGASSQRPKQSHGKRLHRFAKNPIARKGAAARKARQDISTGAGVSDGLSAVSSKRTGSVIDFEYEDEKLTMLPNCCPHYLSTERLQCCSAWERTRLIALNIVTNRYFEWIILLLIFGSSITLCFEDVHLDSNPDLKLALFILNVVFTGMFIIEMLLKWMALGLHRYFTSFWTILDAFIVTVSIVLIGYDINYEAWKPIAQQTGSKTMQSLSGLKALRTLRALRPLRAISRWQGMKMVVNALLFAIPAIFNVLLVCLIFWLIFAIMGVNLFKGKFYKCVFMNGTKVDFNITKQECLAGIATNSTSWVNGFPNFDNIFSAYLSLFQIATFEGWMEIMAAAGDITDEDKQPERDATYLHYLFFVMFIIFGGFFTLNLFTGVIIDNFNSLKKRYEGNLLEAFLTPNQLKYYAAMRKLGGKKPKKIIRRPKNKILAAFFDVATSRKFEIAIFVVILTNMLALAFDTKSNSPATESALAALNVYFCAVYILEACIKILGLRHHYFKVGWNVFDFVLVVLTVLDLALASSADHLPFPPALLRVVRVFRVGRLLRLVKGAKGIRKLLFALIVSLPALLNIGALLALVIFIYAILGMALFKHVPPHDAIDELWNFQTFPRSVLLLFRLATAAGWNEVLQALIQEKAEDGYGDYEKLPCDRGNKNAQGHDVECAPRLSAMLYMVTYIMITYLIIINMYIAIILENFDESNRDEEVGIVEDDLDAFYSQWSRYDPNATQFIQFDQLSEFLASLDPPFNIPKPNVVAIVSFNLPIARGNKIHCLDILHALVKHVLGQIEDTEEFRKLQDQMERKFRKEFPNRMEIVIISSTRLWKLQHNAATLIQRAWREHHRRQLALQARATITPRFSVGRVNFFQNVGEDRLVRRTSVADPTEFAMTGYRRVSRGARASVGAPGLELDEQEPGTSASASAKNENKPFFFF